MKITSLRIRTLKIAESKLQGIASITLDEMIAIHDIKILKNIDKLFLAMPSKAIKPGVFKDSVHPINAQVREAIEQIIFEAYNVCLENDYENVQFDIATEFGETLLEQTLSNFHLVSGDTYKIQTSNDTFIKDEEVTSDISKKRNAFLDWLNN